MLAGLGDVPLCPGTGINDVRCLVALGPERVEQGVSGPCIRRPARNAGEIFEGYSRNSAEFASRPVGHVCLGVNAGNLTIHPPGPGRRAWKSQNCLMIV